jgi:hypothetical protein
LTLTGASMDESYKDQYYKLLLARAN